MAARWSGMSGLLGLLVGVGLVFLALTVYLLWWLINMIPLPQPIRIIITVLFVLICVVVLLDYMPISLPRGRL